MALGQGIEPSRSRDGNLRVTRMAYRHLSVAFSCDRCSVLPRYADSDYACIYKLRSRFLLWCNVAMGMDPWQGIKPQRILSAL